MILVRSVIGQEEAVQDSQSPLQAACPSTQPDNLIVSPLKRSDAILIHHTALPLQ